MNQMTGDEQMESLNYFVGVDWSRHSHEVCLMDGDGNVLGQRQFTHDGEGLRQLADWLVRQSPDDPAAIGVVIEVTHGPVVEALQMYGVPVFSINPKKLDRFRDRFTMAGTKDDRFDARVLAEAVRRDRDLLRLLEPVSDAVQELRGCTQQYTQLREQKVRLVAQLQDLLWTYYPQFMKLPGDLHSNLMLDLLELVPAPGRVKGLHQSSIAKVLKNNRIRKIDAQTVKATLSAPALAVSAGTESAAICRVLQIVRQLRLIMQQLAETQTWMNRLTEDFRLSEVTAPAEDGPCRDVQIIASMPGIGELGLGILLAEAADILRRRDYRALRAYAGVAPVTRQSGRSCQVVRRLGCNAKLSLACYHWARVAIQHDPLSRTKYQALRERGHTHGRSLRGVADRLCKVLCTMLKNQETFSAPVASNALTS